MEISNSRKQLAEEYEKIEKLADEIIVDAIREGRIKPGAKGIAKHRLISHLSKLREESIEIDGISFEEWKKGDLSVGGNRDVLHHWEGSYPESSRNPSLDELDNPINEDSEQIPYEMRRQK